MLVPELQQIHDAFNSRARTGNLKLQITTPTELMLVPQVPDSFPISIQLVAEADIVVTLEPYHEHMSGVEQATSLAMWLLTPYYRVVAMYAAGKLIKTFLELYQDGGWNARPATFFVNPDEGLPEFDEIRIRHQAVFLDSSYLTYYPHAELDQAGCPLGTLLGETIYHQRNGEWHPVNVPDMPQ